MNVLVTGGAGYIGSHTCVELLNSGYGVVVVDNLCNANPKSLDRVRELTGKDLRFYEGDVRDEGLLRKIFAEKAAETAVKEREQFARNSKNAQLAKQEAVSAMLEAQKLAKRMQNDIKGGEKRIQKLEKAKRKAEKRAKANSLSHYILQKLQARDRARENSQIPESDIPNKENNRQ